LTSDSYINRFFQWSTVATLYGLCFFIRTSPNTLQAVLQNDLHLGYADLGLLSATFYYSYGIFQLVGAIASRYIGLHRCFLIYLIVLLIGLLMFSYTQTFEQALLSRILMGLGSSLTFIYTLSLARIVFPQKDFPLYVGITNFIGMIGAICAQTPLELLIASYHWQTIFFGLFCLISALTPWLYRHQKYFENSNNACSSHTLLKNDWKELKANYTQLIFWIIIAFSMISPLLAIPEMWGSLFLETTYHYDSLSASFILSLFFIGVACGSLCHGALSRTIAIDKIILRLLLIEGIGLILFITPTLYSVTLMSLCAFIIGFCASGMLLFFSLIETKYHGNALSIPVFNMSIMIGSSVFQPAIGWALEFLAPTMGLNQALITSFTGLPVLIFSVFIALCFHPLYS